MTFAFHNIKKSLTGAYDNKKYDDEYKKLISEISEKYRTNYQDKDELIKEGGKVHTKSIK